jgi:hypothetical protein
MQPDSSTRDEKSLVAKLASLGSHGTKVRTLAVSAQYSHCANPSSATAVLLARPQFAQFQF